MLVEAVEEMEKVEEVKGESGGISGEGWGRGDGEGAGTQIRPHYVRV